MARMDRMSTTLILCGCVVLGGLAAVPGGEGALPSQDPYAGALLSGPQTWKAVAATGRVESRWPAAAGDAWSAVRRGDRLEAETAVRTHKRSRTTLTRMGDLILVDPLTQIVLPEESLAPATLIRQGMGNALYRIEASAGRSVTIETPWLVAGVKGTVFSVIVGPAHASVSVASGRVEVRSRTTGEAADLLPGDMAVFDAELGIMEVYRERREGVRESGPEISRRARESLEATMDLLEEASASLDRKEMDGLALEEMLRIDRSLWMTEGGLNQLRLETSLEEEQRQLSGDGSGGLLDSSDPKRR